MINAATLAEHDVKALSIIVATFNAAGSLERCLNSIVQQELSSWELLIADGGSTDGTLGLIREHQAHIAWWCSGDDSGIYDAWNKALGRALGEYVCFLGSDDVFRDRGALSRLFAAIGAERYDLVTSRGIIHDRRANRKVLFGSEWNYRRIGRRMVVCHPGLLHHRSLFERYGVFDTRYRIAGDLDFLLRLPPDIRTLHVDSTSVVIDGGGVSRTRVMERLREQRDILVRCERYGPLRGWLAWIDKLWRLPVARLLKLPI